MGNLPTYVLERAFDAPRELVWKTWTDPELLPRWYGPGVETIVHRLELKPGGLWLLEMQWGGNSQYQRVEYTAVSPPGRLVWLHATSDADWNITANPMMPGWPRVLLTTVTFEQDGARTKLRLTWCRMRRAKPRSPASRTRWPAWTRAGAPAWSCSKNCSPNCRAEPIA